MGFLGNIIGSKDKLIDELKLKMMNSAIANDFETWFKSQLESSSFLNSQYNYYDDCERLVIVTDDYVGICFEIANANVSDECVCNFANTLGYKPLSANGLSYSNGKSVSKRVLITTFAEVVKERIKKALDTFPGEYTFVGYGVLYDDGTDKSASYLDRLSQKLDTNLIQSARFRYKVPKQEQKSAF